MLKIKFIWSYHSLLILTKNTKKVKKNNFKALKKSEIAIFQQYTALYTTYSHVLDGEIKAIAANWLSYSQNIGGYTRNTDCLLNAGPTASTCGPML